MDVGTASVCAIRIASFGECTLPGHVEALGQSLLLNCFRFTGAVSLPMPDRWGSESQRTQDLVAIGTCLPCHPGSTWNPFPGFGRHQDRVYSGTRFLECVRR